MKLFAYALGLNLIAAARPADALAVMERCEGAGRWSLDDVRELADDELHVPVDSSSPETVAEALARSSGGGPPGGQLIRWDFPGH